MAEKNNPEVSAYLRAKGIEKMYEEVVWNLPPKEEEAFEEYRERVTRHELIPEFITRRKFYELCAGLFKRAYGKGEENA